MKELTVIVPVYNGEKTIGRTLGSLVNQTSDDIEILVINDGSMDDTENIVNSYADKYANITLINRKNGGIASARNTGINNINTKYFGFLDSDDYVEPTMFEKMLAKIKKDDSDLCVCNFYWEWPNKQRLQVEGPYSTPNEMITKLFATLWNKIYKTELIKRFDLSFPDGYRYEDSYFLYCLAANEIKISFVSESFVHYMQTSSSITHTFNDKVKDMIHVFEEIQKYYINHDLYDKYHDELEFLFAKFFLGNSFLRTCQINDKEERNKTLQMSWDIIEKNYPNFKDNKYVKEMGGKKGLYYQLINKSNYMFIGNFLHILGILNKNLY